MSYFEMSHEEQKKQHETISAIDIKVSYIIKLGKIIIPILVGLFGAIIYIGHKAISINEWNNSLVKQPQFANYKIYQAKIDSTQTADLDTVKAHLPIVRIGHIIQYRDRNGILHEKTYN